MFLCKLSSPWDRGQRRPLELSDAQALGRILFAY